MGGCDRNGRARRPDRPTVNERLTRRHHLTRGAEAFTEKSRSGGWNARRVQARRSRGVEVRAGQGRWRREAKADRADHRRQADRGRLEGRSSLSRRDGKVEEAGRKATRRAEENRLRPPTLSCLLAT